MKVFNCILGVFAILGAVYCIFFPGMSFLHAGWILTMLLGGWGICAIFDYSQKKNDQSKSKAEMAAGIVSLIVGIGAAAVSIIGIFIPAVRLMVDITILWMLIGWFICTGTASIIGAAAAKKAGAKSWVFTLVLGIITVIGALYGLFHLIVFTKAIGYMIGALLLIYGIRLFCTLGEEN